MKNRKPQNFNRSGLSDVWISGLHAPIKHACGLLLLSAYLGAFPASAEDRCADEVQRHHRNTETPAQLRMNDAAPSGDAAVPRSMSPTEREAARLGIRKDFFEAVTSACAKLYPDQAEEYRQTYSSWRRTNQAPLQDAAVLMAQRTSRADAAELSELVNAEKKLLQNWQVEQLKIPLSRAPRSEDCSRIIAALPALP